MTSVDPIDANRVARAEQWGRVPPPERTKEWVHEFESAFWPAPLVSEPERLVYGDRDGRPYRIVSLPPKSLEPTLPGIEPPRVRPASLVDSLIERGQGLFFTDEANEPLCVFTLGEVLSYRLYGRAFARPLTPPDESLMQLHTGEMIELASPHESTFPNWVRINVRRYLQQTLGIQAPHAVWVRFPNGHSGIVFDLETGRVGDEAKSRPAFNFDALRWFLPGRIAYFHVAELARTAEMKPF